MPAVESSRASPRSISPPPARLPLAHFEGRQQVALPLAFHRAPSISPADGDRRAIRRAEEVASGLEEGIARFLWPSTESRFCVSISLSPGNKEGGRRYYSSHLVFLPFVGRRTLAGVSDLVQRRTHSLGSPVVSAWTSRLRIGQELADNTSCVGIFGGNPEFLQ